MARTYRGLDGKADGKAGTRKGADRCPPRAYRRQYGTKVTRMMGHTLERLAVRDPDAMPVYTEARLPYFT